MEQCTHRQLRGEKKFTKPHQTYFGRDCYVVRKAAWFTVQNNSDWARAIRVVGLGKLQSVLKLTLDRRGASVSIVCMRAEWSECDNIVELKLFSLTPLSSAPNQRAPCFVPLPASRTRTFRNRLRTELKAARLVCQSPVAGQSSFTGSLESRFSIDVCWDDVQIETSRRAASDNQHQRGSLHNKRSAFESWLQFTDCFYNPLNRNLKSGTGVRRPWRHSIRNHSMERGTTVT